MSELRPTVDVEAVLAGSRIFAGLDQQSIDEIARLSTPFFYESGEQLFSHGDPAESVFIIGSGLLEAVQRLPGGEEERLAFMGVGELVGEIALIEGQIRYATVRALEATSGVKISRHGFNSIRFGFGESSNLVMQRICEYLIELLLGLQEAILSKVGGDAEYQTKSEPQFASPQPMLEEFSEEEKAHLKLTPFFKDFDPTELDELLVDLPRIHLERNQVLIPLGGETKAFYVVMQGVIESTLRRTTLTQRVRLAGPGAAPTYMSLDNPEPSPVMCRARERTVALVFSEARYRDLFQGGSVLSRRFLCALQIDLVRALKDANRAPAWSLIAQPNSASNQAH